MRCEDWPCCGHTDGLPCDWVAPDRSADPHAYCDHENGSCEVGDYFDDDLDDEVSAPGGVFVMGAPDQETEDDLRRIVTGEDTPIALEG